VLQIFYYSPRDPSYLSDGSPFAGLLSDFLDGDDEASDEFRNDRFKLIPSIVKGERRMDDINCNIAVHTSYRFAPPMLPGPWIVKQTVGNTPAIMGRKLRQPCYRADHYFELDIDVNSTRVGSAVINLCSGYSKNIAVDLAYLIQGQCQEELPEQILGNVRLAHVDFTKATKRAAIRVNGEIPPSTN
jgi:hypothetical protein